MGMFGLHGIVGAEGFVIQVSEIAFLLGCTLVALFAPNSQEIMSSASLGLGHVVPSRKVAWNLSRRWAFITAILLSVSLLELNRASEFLYFQF